MANKIKWSIPVFSTPSCYGCEFFVNNIRKSSFVPKACGRTLYPGEQYCIFGPKAIQFHKSWASAVYPGCPRKYGYLKINIYVKDVTAKYRDYAYLRGGSERLLPPDAREYIFRRSATTALKPKKVYIELYTGDVYDLLGHSPEKLDIIELDNGITSDFLMLQPDGEWKKIYPEKEKFQNGQTGNFRILAHEEYAPARYREDSDVARKHCLGYVRGHFGPGKFVPGWVDLCGREKDQGASELETLLETLQAQGFLHSLDALYNYCLARPWAALPGASGKEYGFYTHGQKHVYYFRCLPGEDSAYNVYCYCYTWEGSPNG